MTALNERYRTAVEQLPPLPRGLFLLHNFHNVGLDDMAARLGANPDAIATCFAEARAMIRAHVCFREARRSNPERRGRLIAELEEGLRRDYRRSLEAAFGESGYGGAVGWPDRSAGIDGDETAAAAFIVTLLPNGLRKAATKARRPDVATIDLWRSIALWRRRPRRQLLRVTDAVRCAGWQPFDEWLAQRIAPGRLYPHGYREPAQRHRRPLPEERQVADAGTVRVPERWMSQPVRTQQVWVLFHHYGRPVEEIAWRLGIGRGQVRRRLDRANYAILGDYYPSLADRVRFRTMVTGLCLGRRWEIIKSAFYS